MLQPSDFSEILEQFPSVEVSSFDSWSTIAIIRSLLFAVCFFLRIGDDWPGRIRLWSSYWTDWSADGWLFLSCSKLWRGDTLSTSVSFELSLVPFWIVARKEFKVEPESLHATHSFNCKENQPSAGGQCSRVAFPLLYYYYISECQDDYGAGVWFNAMVIVFLNNIFIWIWLPVDRYPWESRDFPTD